MMSATTNPIPNYAKEPEAAPLLELPLQVKEFSPSATLRRRLQWFVGAGAASVVLLGLLVVVGWMLGFEPLMSVLPGHATMKINTALAFVSAGAALAARLAAQTTHSRRTALVAKRVCFAFAGFTLGCGGISLAEYLFGLDLHVDQLLFADHGAKVFPGRMAEITAINFSLAGISMLLPPVGAWRAASRAAATWLCVNAFAAIIAYLYGVEMFYGSMNYTAMALHTGAGFLILGAGLVLMETDSAFLHTYCAPRKAAAWCCAVPCPGWSCYRWRSDGYIYGPK